MKGHVNCVEYLVISNFFLFTRQIKNFGTEVANKPIKKNTNMKNC